MKKSSHKQFISFIDDHLDDLTPNQYVRFIELTFERLPLEVLTTMDVWNRGKKYSIGFKKENDICPFCGFKEKPD